MNLSDCIGYLAAFLTTAAFVPQAWLTWKTKRADGVSLGMYAVFIAGLLLWLAYGLMTKAWPVIAANGVTFLLAVFILAMKLAYRGTPPCASKR